MSDLVSPGIKRAEVLLRFDPSECISHGLLFSPRRNTPVVYDRNHVGIKPTLNFFPHTALIKFGPARYRGTSEPARGKTSSRHCPIYD